MKYLLAAAILFFLNAVMFIRIHSKVHANGPSFHEVWEKTLMEDHPETWIGRVAMRIVYGLVSVVAFVSWIANIFHK